MSSDRESVFSGSQDDSLSDSEDSESSTTPPSSSPHEKAVQKRKQMASRKNYFEGQARHPYRLRKRLDKSFKDMDEEFSLTDEVCDYCRPALSKIAEGFHRLN